jgi:hypothetical protein
MLTEESKQIFCWGGDRAGGKGVCGRFMSPARETQSMREIRLLRRRLQHKGGGLTGINYHMIMTLTASYLIGNGLLCDLICIQKTFNNISVISWQPVLLVEETGVPRENHKLSQVTDKLYRIKLHRLHLVMNGV